FTPCYLQLKPDLQRFAICIPLRYLDKCRLMMREKQWGFTNDIRRKCPGKVLDEGAFCSATPVSDLFRGESAMNETELAPASYLWIPQETGWTTVQTGFIHSDYPPWLERSHANPNFQI